MTAHLLLGFEPKSSQLSVLILSGMVVPGMVWETAGYIPVFHWKGHLQLREVNISLLFFQL